MNKQAPESFTDLAAELALCVADVLSHPECPDGLRDVLSEITDELTNAIAPSVSELFRALAGLAKARDTGAGPEAETVPTSRFCAKNGAQNQGRQALAKATTN